MHHYINKYQKKEIEKRKNIIKKPDHSWKEKNSERFNKQKFKMQLNANQQFETRKMYDKYITLS